MEQMDIDTVPPPRSIESLPWVEKYRPAQLEELVSQQDIVNTIVRFVDKKSLPHLLFYGPPGTGKTTTILACARRLYGKSFRNMVLELNASDDRGIEVVREEIKNFASTRSIFSSSFKLIILDEADSMTTIAQAALRRIIEKYSRNVRFCIICNYVSKILPALQSRCSRFRFNPLDLDSVRGRLKVIAEAEQVCVTDDGYTALLELCAGDMRRALNVMQSTYAAYGRVDFDGVYATTASPLPADIERVLAWLLKDDFTTAYCSLRELCTQKGYALIDILGLLYRRVIKLDMPNASKIVLYETMAEIEHRLSKGCGDNIQASALAGAFRIAVELVE